jgi:inorganic pyrophosphatase
VCRAALAQYLSRALKTPDPEGIPPTATVVHAVIECPAGSSIKYTYDEKKKELVPHTNEDGSVKRHAYLPYPANYGFVPGTVVDEASGGDGGALDIFVLCETLPAGSAIDVDVIGLLRISAEVAIDDILLAVPRDRMLRTMDVMHVKDLPDGVLAMLKTWVVKHNMDKRVRITEVKGAKAGMKAIQKWAVKA